MNEVFNYLNCDDDLENENEIKPVDVEELTQVEQDSLKILIILKDFKEFDLDNNV